MALRSWDVVGPSKPLFFGEGRTQTPLLGPWRHIAFQHMGKAISHLLNEKNIENEEDKKQAQELAAVLQDLPTIKNGVLRFWRMRGLPQGEGGEQGAALMPALFCLAMRPALQEIQARMADDELVLAYLDDIYVLTRPERTRAAYDIVAEVLARVCNVEVNRSKLVA